MNSDLIVLLAEFAGNASLLGLVICVVLGIFHAWNASKIFAEDMLKSEEADVRSICHD